MMNPALRRFTYATHLTSSIGWIGAVFVFLAMAGVALTRQDEATVRGAYLVMAPAAWLVLVPLAHLSLFSGIVLSLGTAWGLIRHYWVVLKLAITVFCTIILLIYMGTFREMAGIAADPVVDLETVRNASPLVHSILAVVLLLVATALGVYKPFGMTPYGRRLAFPDCVAVAGTHRVADTDLFGRRGWGPYLVLGVIGLMLLVIALHMVGGRHGGH